MVTLLEGNRNIGQKQNFCKYFGWVNALFATSLTRPVAGM